MSANSEEEPTPSGELIRSWSEWTLTPSIRGTEALRSTWSRGPSGKVIRKHRSYGDRRIRPDLEEAMGQVVNGKRLGRSVKKGQVAMESLQAWEGSKRGTARIRSCKGAWSIGGSPRVNT